MKKNERKYRKSRNALNRFFFNARNERDSILSRRDECGDPPRNKRGTNVTLIPDQAQGVYPDASFSRQ